jgi:SAM-dependent methyltransferase
MRSLREICAFTASWGAPVLRLFYAKDKKHPIDKLYGIRTSARVSRFERRTGSQFIDRENIGYAGVQPSVMRRALSIVPIADRTAFIDIGCGKGRALAVATEFPFAKTIGIEISPVLSAIARANAKRLAANLNGRVEPEIMEGDATNFAVPDCDALVLFAYNPFKRPLVEMLLRRIEAVHAAQPALKMFLVYYNPVHAELFDKSPIMTRFFARKFDLIAEELEVADRGFHDSVVIWQLGGQTALPALPGADAEVRVTLPDIGADVVNQ